MTDGQPGEPDERASRSPPGSGRLDWWSLHARRLRCRGPTIRGPSPVASSWSTAAPAEVPSPRRWRRDPGSTCCGRALEPEERPLELAWSDEHLVVVRKPAGLLTHPSANRRTGTLVNRLLGMGLPLAPGGGQDRPVSSTGWTRARPACWWWPGRPDPRGPLRAVQATRGGPPLPRAVGGGVDPDRFEMEALLARTGARIRVDATGGREAATEFEVLERRERTLLEAAPRPAGPTRSGCTCRRSATRSWGTPYGGGGDEARRLGLARPFLHSWRLAFDHPETSERHPGGGPLPDEEGPGAGRQGGLTRRLVPRQDPLGLLQVEQGCVRTSSREASRRSSTSGASVRTRSGRSAWRGRPRAPAPTGRAAPAPGGAVSSTGAVTCWAAGRWPFRRSRTDDGNRARRRTR